MNKKELKDILVELGCKENNVEDAIFNLALKYYSSFKKREKELPYWINLVDIMNLGYRNTGKNENGHSLFLCELFRYIFNGTHPVFNSFMNRFTDRKELKCKMSDEGKITVKHTFAESGRHPDIYVNQLEVYNSEETISVVFENKIDNAEDRDKQMEDYIKGMCEERKNMKTHSPDSNCYAFYLIYEHASKKNDNIHDDKGRQKVDDKNVLGYLIPDENYILLSYKEDILPWMKSEQLSLPKEKYLNENLKLYIDHLENRFGLRENVNNLKADVMNKICDIEKLNLEKLLALQDGLQVIINDCKDEIVKSFIGAFKGLDFVEDKKDRKGNYDKGFKCQLITDFSIWCEINISDSKRDFHIGIAVDDNKLESKKQDYYDTYIGNLRNSNSNEKKNVNSSDFKIKVREFGLVDDTQRVGSGYVQAWSFDDGDLDFLKGKIESELSDILNTFIKQYPSLMSNKSSGM